MPEQLSDIPDPDYLLMDEADKDYKPSLLPMPTRLPIRHPLRVAREYLRDCDIHQAIIRAGYDAIKPWLRENHRAKMIMESDRFQSALLQAADEIRISTLARIATSEKGTAAVTASEKLCDSVVGIKKQVRPKDVKKKDW